MASDMAKKFIFFRAFLSIFVRNDWSNGASSELQHGPSLKYHSDELFKDLHVLFRRPKTNKNSSAASLLYTLDLTKISS